MYGMKERIYRWLKWGDWERYENYGEWKNEKRR